MKKLLSPTWTSNWIWKMSPFSCRDEREQIYLTLPCRIPLFEKMSWNPRVCYPPHTLFPAESASVDIILPTCGHIKLIFYSISMLELRQWELGIYTFLGTFSTFIHSKPCFERTKSLKNEDKISSMIITLLLPSSIITTLVRLNHCTVLQFFQKNNENN